MSHKDFLCGDTAIGYSEYCPNNHTSLGGEFKKTLHNVPAQSSRRASVQDRVGADTHDHHALLDYVTHPPQTDTPGTGTAQSSLGHIAECYTNVDTNRRHIYVCINLVVFISVNYPWRSEPCAKLRHSGLICQAGDTSVGDPAHVTQGSLAHFTVSTRVTNTKQQARSSSRTHSHNSPTQ